MAARAAASSMTARTMGASGENMTGTLFLIRSFVKSRHLVQPGLGAAGLTADRPAPVGPRFAAGPPGKLGGTMRKDIVAFIIGLYVIAAFAFGVVVRARQGPVFVDDIFVAGTVGSAASLFVTSAVVPIVVWALLGFRAERAAGPLALWAVLGGTLAYFLT